MTKTQKRKTPLSQLIANMTDGDKDFQNAVTTRTVTPTTSSTCACQSSAPEIEA